MEWKEYMETLGKEIFKCSGCGKEKPMSQVTWTVAKNRTTGKWFSSQCDECTPGMKT